VLCCTWLALPAQAAETEPDKAGPPYVHLDTIFVSVIEGNRVTQQVGITLVLELNDAQSRPDVEAKKHQLTDAFFQELYGYFQTRAAAKEKVDEPFLKKRLLATAGKVVGPNAIKEVLIEQLIQRSK